MDETVQKIIQLVDYLQRSENECVEFKHNNGDPEEIGEYISALANTAALFNTNYGYLLWGIEDSSRNIVGTTFDPRAAKIGNQELESWLINHLHPRPHLRFYNLERQGLPVVLLEIPAAREIPTRFKDYEYIRVGTYKKKLRDYPQKEQELWSMFQKVSFETDVALESQEIETALSLLDFHPYFELTQQPMPKSREAIITRLVSEKFLVPNKGLFDVTNLGAILFARDLDKFPRLSRKAMRIVSYKGTNKLETIRERLEKKGFAVGFPEIVRYVKEQVPSNEYISEALRAEVSMYPELAVRELIANALIHQNFYITGAGPIIEIYADRIEITNPGTPLIDIERLLDQPPRSRNEALAAFMRRINICEERGSSIDKVIAQVEIYQLPPPDFQIRGDNFTSILFAYKKFAQMNQPERIRACYHHACLRYVSNEVMTNASLRERFGIESKNYPMVSRVIKETLKTGVIKAVEATKTYLPFWA
jgi:ATP-dependent DNA helicase RecG